MSRSGDTERRPVRLGMLTPSSNTVLEPTTSAMLAGLDGVTVHFARVRVKTVSLDDAGVAQFDIGHMLAAADQLADAGLDVLAWNGTSASWLGFDSDVRLCEEIAAATGITTVTTTLSLISLLETEGYERVGLVTPYTGDVQARIVENFARAALEVVAERHLSLTDSLSYGDIGPSVIESMIREVAAARAEAIIPLCTNLAAAPLAAGLERELGVPILDSVAVTLRAALAAAGIDPARVQGWGCVFSSRSSGGFTG